jgi:hypothetical protein
MSEPEIEHVYGGDVGENPVQGPGVTAMAGLASASAAPGQAQIEEPDGGVD